MNYTRIIKGRWEDSRAEKTKKKKDNVIRSLRQWNNWKSEVRGFLGQQTRQSDVPSNKSRNDTECTAGTLGSNAAVELSCSEQDESKEQEEEQGNHTNRGAVRCDQQDKSHDSPSNQIDTERMLQEMSIYAFVSSSDTSTRDKDESIGEPETTVT